MSRKQEPVLKIGSVLNYLGVKFNIKAIAPKYVVLVGKPNGKVVELKLTPSIINKLLS
jgi:hypothetical protein